MRGINYSSARGRSPSRRAIGRTIATLIASQLPPTAWHAAIRDPRSPMRSAFADPCAHRLTLKGPTMRDTATHLKRNRHHHDHDHSTRGQPRVDPQSDPRPFSETLSFVKPPVLRSCFPSFVSCLLQKDVKASQLPRPAQHPDKNSPQRFRRSRSAWGLSGIPLYFLFRAPSWC